MAAELNLHLDLCLAAIRAAEAGPSQEELAAAPLMENWCVLRSPSGSPVLWGKVIDHPRLGTTMMTTSRLVALDAKMGWARSLSRWFRVGDPFTPAPADLRLGYARSASGRALEDFHEADFTTLDDIEQLRKILSLFRAEAMILSALPRAPGSGARP